MIGYGGFKKTLAARYGKEEAAKLWDQAEKEYRRMCAAHPEIQGDSKLVLPAAALYTVLSRRDGENALPLLLAYGRQMGEKLGRAIHGLTSIPGVSKLLWRNMPKLMRKASGPEKGYTRRIVSETDRLVGVDILSCPIHDAAVAVGVPEAALVICAMDKAQMSGFKYIDYTRTTAVAEGAECCDYRLAYNPEKK